MADRKAWNRILVYGDIAIELEQASAGEKWKRFCWDKTEWQTKRFAGRDLRGKTIYPQLPDIEALLTWLKIQPLYQPQNVTADSSRYDQNVYGGFHRLKDRLLEAKRRGEGGQR